MVPTRMSIFGSVPVPVPVLLLAVAPPSEPNIEVGSGLGGDQFRPDAVVDVARNVYVAFQDTTSGAEVVFSRFNASGTFDPPLAPSTRAGSAGVVADNPSVATDRYGAVYLAWDENRSGPEKDVVFARAD